jgi:Flp pilus assembly protein TadD
MKKLKSKLLTLGFVGILALSSALAGCGQNPQDKNPQQDSSGVVGSKEKISRKQQLKSAAGMILQKYMMTSQRHTYLRRTLTLTVKP